MVNKELTAVETQVLGHEPGLFLLFFTEMWERFSYYGMRALLTLFLVSEIAAGGWAWSRESALQLYAIYTGLVYLTPILGGIVADRLLGNLICIKICKKIYLTSLKSCLQEIQLNLLICAGS